MRTLVSNAISSSQCTTSIFNYSSLPRKNRIFLNLPSTKPLPRYKVTTLCSCSAEYGGWADLNSVNDSGESNQLNRLLSSLGIDEKKYAFVYLLGFVCALAVSRVRISSIVVFPASFLVFAVGFSFGIVNGGDLNEVMSLFGSNGGKKNKKKIIKDDEVRVSIENLRNLVDLLNGFDVKIMNLKNSMRKDIDSNRISKGDLISYIGGVESIGQAVLQAKSMIEGHMDGMPVDRKKEMEGEGFNFSQLIAGFRDKSFGPRNSKVKDIVKNDSTYTDASGHNQANILSSLVEDKKLKADNDNDMVKEAYERKTIGRMATMTVFQMETGSKQGYSRDEYVIKDNKMRFTKNRNLVQTWESDDGLLDSDFSANLKQRRAKEFFHQEKGKFKKNNGSNMLCDDLESTEKEAHDEAQNENRIASSPSSEISNDMLFNEYVTEANGLLKQAREWLRHRGIDEDAENMLYKSTELLSKAIDMKPVSLLAVGQLGNTYLLHGELKLKLSRKLRALLAQSDFNVVDNEVSRREKLVEYLVNVCEECEELLVKAGKKFRLALSIDGDDMRALYNWGLALSFRAQLIADIGPEAALDADKVYLAAIDKFNAMMSKSNAHTPDALFRWGVALQQRSRLRTRNFREKVKLLSQAKRLYEDALLMDSNNLQVKEALLTCESELRYKNYY